MLTKLINIADASQTSYLHNNEATKSDVTEKVWYSQKNRGVF